MKNRLKPTVNRKRRVSPLKLDPTRTGLLRAKMLKTINQKFVRLAFDIYSLVNYDDVFGLDLAIVDNSFCATGPGGGIDPTCSPGENKPDKDDKPKPRKSKAKLKVAGSSESISELETKVESLRKESRDAYAEFEKLEASKPEADAPQLVRDKYVSDRADLAVRWSRADRELADIKQQIESKIRTEKVIKESGLVYSDQELPSIVGAPDDATVMVNGYNYGGGQLTIHVSHSQYSASRTAKIVDGQKVMVNNSFFATKQGSGLGSKVFLDQVENLRDLGYDRIETWAARGPGMNGYYTWPRLGYDQKISEFRDRRTRERIKKAFPEAQSVLDIMATPEGREWWKKNGTNMRKAKFDLKDGSRSLAVLDAYLKERAARPARNSVFVANALPFSRNNEDDIPPDRIENTEEIEADSNGEPLLPRDEATTTNAPRQQWRFETRLEQLKRFEEWLRAKIAQYITSKNDELLWERYAEDGFRKGAGRAFDDAKRGDMTPAERRRDDFLREAFANPVSTDKIKILASRSFTDLKGVSEAMATAMGRTLTDGLVQGKSPREIGRDLVKTVDDIGRSRALTIARTEIVRAHAEGQLHALDKMGVREVGVAVEWSVTSVNGQPVETVCQMCRPMNGVVLSIEEAAGMIPRHPNCRCAWVPANVGEPTDKQKRTRARIVAAIAQSRAKQRGKKGKESGWGKIVVTAQRPESVLNNAAAVYPPEHPVLSLLAFCPTGPGGGIDPTCSPGESVQVHDNTDKKYNTRFTVDGKDFFFEAVESDGAWYVGFGLQKDRGGNTSQMTNDPTVSPVKVLRQVERSLTQFVREKSPDKIVFTAEKYEGSRVKLYDRALPQMGKAYGYSVETADYPALKEYMLVKGAG